MKRIAGVLVVLMVVMGCIQGQNTVETKGKVKWYSLKEALELNKKEPRKIIIDVYTDWCGWCKRMDAETFSQNIIADYLNKNFYPVKFNAEGHDSVEFAGHKFYNPGDNPRSTHQFAMALFQAQKLSPGYPSIAYLNENLQLIGVLPGYMTPKQIEPVLNFIVTDKYKTTTLEEYEKTFVSKVQ